MACRGSAPYSRGNLTLARSVPTTTSPGMKPPSLAAFLSSKLGEAAPPGNPFYAAAFSAERSRPAARDASAARCFVGPACAIAPRPATLLWRQ